LIEQARIETIALFELLEDALCELLRPAVSRVLSSITEITVTLAFPFSWLGNNGHTINT
jgi:hypothetical protein